jgi:hypothetical protein
MKMTEEGLDWDTRRRSNDDWNNQDGQAPAPSGPEKADTTLKPAGTDTIYRYSQAFASPTSNQPDAELAIPETADQPRRRMASPLASVMKLF